ncbi:MAG: YdcF family protein, partial [Deltaproteobacteria bacterium]|nr:YdcF family protein [Deltaproteobacteria bacterium]
CGADRREGGFAGANKMALEAIKQRIPQERIIIEQDSKDTRQNVINSSHILKQIGWNNVILVTNDFHMRRAVRLFEKENIQAYPAPI